MHLEVTKWVDEFHIGFSIEHGIYPLSFWLELGIWSLGIVFGKEK